MRLRSVALGAMLSVCAGDVALSQQAQPGQRQLHGSLSVTGSYDSNFARSDSATADARSIAKEEYTLRPQVSLSALQPFGRQALLLNGSAGYDFHRKNPDLDSHRYDVNAGYTAALGMCQASANQTYSAAQSDLADFENVRTKNQVERIGTSLALACGRSEGIIGSLSAARLDTKNSALVQRPADSTNESIGAQLGYGHPTLGSLSLVYGYSTAQVPNRIIPGRPIGDGFFTESLGLSARRDFGSRLSFGVTGSRSTVKREFAPGGAPLKFTTTTYGANASYNFGTRLTLQARGERSIRPAVRAGKLYDIFTSADVTARYKLGTRYVLSGGYGIQDTDSNQDTSQVFREVITSSRTQSVYGGVSYRQNDRASLSFDVRYDDRTANLPQFNYSAIHLSLTTSVGF